MDLQDPNPLYDGPRKIKKEKYQHLQSLKEVIPADYHSFYDGLMTKTHTHKKKRVKRINTL
jgi:hypothetical protein